MYINDRKMKTCNKRIFTKRQAEAILRLKPKGSRKRKKEVRTYFCEECNGWHLTSMEVPPEEIVEVDVINKEKWSLLLQ